MLTLIYRAICHTIRLNNTGECAGTCYGKTFLEFPAGEDPSGEIKTIKVRPMPDHIK